MNTDEDESKDGNQDANDMGEPRAGSNNPGHDASAANIH